MKTRLSILLGSLALSACATVALPPERLDRTEASIRSAEELGAATVPNAKFHLQLAKDQTVLAKKLAQDGEGRAPYVLARAEVDADLAIALTREATALAGSAKAADDLSDVQKRSAP